MTSQNIQIYDIEQDSLYESKLFALNGKVDIEELQRVFKEIKKKVKKDSEPEINHAWYIEDIEKKRLKLLKHNWRLD